MLEEGIHPRDKQINIIFIISWGGALSFIMDASVISQSNSKPFNLRGLRQTFYYAHELYGSGIE